MEYSRPLFVSFLVLLGTTTLVALSGSSGTTNRHDGKRLFESETFGGNGRTCRTCHSAETGTVSPRDAQQRFQLNPLDPLFVHDGSDDGQGNGVTRMTTNATVLMEIPLPLNVRLADDPTARTVILARGIPTTLNTPALDPVLMLDGRQPTLELQAAGAIHDHAQAAVEPTFEELQRIKEFQLTDAFFSSPELRDFAQGLDTPRLPKGRTASEKRGRLFFEQVAPDPTFKAGLCGSCHGGPLMNQTNEFLPLFGPQVPAGTRFQSVGVSELNHLGNPVRHFIFTTPGGDVDLFSADPGRALITGEVDDVPRFDSVNAFKIPILRGITRTAPYFHDNSAKTLEDVVAHYTQFFQIVTGGFLVLTPQDQADIVAFMKLL